MVKWWVPLTTGVRFVACQRKRIAAGAALLSLSTACRVGLSSNQPAHDLTLYPILQFGFLANPSKSWSLFIETDLAGGLTTQDFGDSALIFYPTAGVSYSFDGP
jgi:hypothetical protein